MEGMGFLSINIKSHLGSNRETFNVLDWSSQLVVAFVARLHAFKARLPWSHNLVVFRTTLQSCQHFCVRVGVLRRHLGRIMSTFHQPQSFHHLISLSLFLSTLSINGYIQIDRLWLLYIHVKWSFITFFVYHSSSGT